MSIEKRIKTALRGQREGRETALLQLAADLGCSRSGAYAGGGHASVLLDEAEIIHRIREAARSRREERLWIIAALSAAASVISAAGAVVAALLSSPC
jgi:hypothetical protein